MGFFAFMDLWSQNRFSVCGYRCVNGLGFQRDSKSLGFRVSNRGESALLAHDFAVHKSSVLYLLRPLTLERGCFLAEHTISGGCRTGGFWRAMCLKIRICPSDKIRLFGCRWCCEAEKFCKNFGAQQHHRGSGRYIKTQPSDVSFVISPASVEPFPELLSRSPGICFLPDGDVLLFLL